MELEIFLADFESSLERTKFYCEDITDKEWRILLTWWTWASWEKISVKNSLILLCSKQIGFANCRCGCENSLLKICDSIDFDLGGPDDPLYEELSKEEIQTLVRAMRYDRKMARIKSRRSQRKKKARRS